MGPLHAILLWRYTKVGGWGAPRTVTSLVHPPAGVVSNGNLQHVARCILLNRGSMHALLMALADVTAILVDRRL